MDPFTEQTVTAVGVTLVHFLWQGAALGIITAAVLAACPRAMSRTRYLIAGAGLAAMMTAPLVTLGLVWQAAPAIDANLPAFATATAAGATAPGAPLVFGVLTPWLPTAVVVWALGVLLLTARLLHAWWRTEDVRRRDVRAVGGGLEAALQRLARDLGIRRAIALFESPWVDVPTVIGWLRPTILLPIGALTGLSVQQIEAVLSHELAHIKRHDYLVNALQNLAETVFFYHPAVWWLSRQIRTEREHCCDDVAVETSGNAVMYAHALATLEASRQRQATFALAATDGPLVSRVRRLLGPAHVDRRRPSLPIAACVAVILAVVAFGVRAQGPDRAPADEAIEVEASPDVPPVEPAERVVTLTRPNQNEAPVDVRPDDMGVAESIAVVAVAPATRQAPAEPAAPAQPRDRPPVVEATQVTPAPTPAPAPAPVRVGGDIREPKKIRDVRPLYPAAAQRAGVSGVVILEAVIDKEGVPAGITVLRSIPDLDQAAINAVRQWRYTPSLLNGVPVSVMMTVTVNFTLTYEQLQSRYEALQRELEASPSLEDARRRSLQLDLARLEQQIARSREAAERRAQAAEAAASQAPSRDADGVLRVGGDIKEPRKIRFVAPVYPAVAQEAKVSGVVVLEATVDAEGNVSEVVIRRSIPMLDQAALDAVRQWKYMPTLLNGLPTPLRMTMTVNFTMN